MINLKFTSLAMLLICTFALSSTALFTPSIVLGQEQKQATLSMTVNLKPTGSQFGFPEYGVKTFDISTANNNNTNKLCPSGNCQFTIEYGDFRHANGANGYARLLLFFGTSDMHAQRYTKDDM